MLKRRRLVIANWKMNPEKISEARDIIRHIGRRIPRGLKVVICPPFLYLGELFSAFGRSKISFGVQNLFWKDKGAFTGEISPIMVKNAGGTFSIVGHSEVRALGETNQTVNKKILAAVRAGLSVILCVGELGRDEHGHYFGALKQQITESLGKISREFIPQVIIAYEPLWAIGKKGSGAITPRDLHQTSLFIRKVIHDHCGKGAGGVSILYGGAVAPENASKLITEGEVEGLLVGHESLKPEHFVAILKAVTDSF